jgi:hypothetical protein
MATIDIQDIEYIDEELDDIEYTEILSFDEMSKINPSFIALDKDEIYNNLYNFFKNKKKSDLIRSLFYEILINIESKNGKINDYSNYVFAVEGEIEKYGEDFSKDAAFNFIDKYNNKSDLADFVKRRFCIEYNRKTDKIKLKPIHNTNTIISTDEQNTKPEFPKYHPIIKDFSTTKCRQINKVEDIYNINDGDDINLPIIGSYYKIPTSTNEDYLYSKIASHLSNTINTNYKPSNNYRDIYELIKNTRPDISMIINEINKNKDSFYLDYSNINNIFKKYDYSLDFISDKDLEVLYDYMVTIIKNEKERKNIHKGFKIKKPVLINRKLTFFDNIDKAFKVINISADIVAFLEKTRDLINNYKNDNIQTNIVPLKNYNLYDIIKQINEDAISIEDIIEELKISIKNINIENTLDTINDILDAKENFENIKEYHKYIKNLFIHSREHIFDYDKDGKHYVISKRENKAIYDGNDIDNYEGAQDDDDIIDDENKGIANDIAVDASNKIANVYDLNRYISNITFRNEKGFIEMLKIILEMIKKINDVANIDIDFDSLSNYLFKKYRSISTRYDKYLKEFEKKNVDDAPKYAKKYAVMTPAHISYSKHIDKIHADIIKKVNDNFIENINVVFYNSICFWIVETQENIINKKISLDMNYLNPNHIDKLTTRGLLYYIIEIIGDFFKYNDNNKNDYMINIKGLKQTLINIIQDEYKDKDKEILNELLNKNDTERKNKCNTDKYKYTDEERYYIDKLLFTPSNNSKFEKIHKYIQGCCLRKLDNNFNDISDFEITNNTEIIKLKDRYSNMRLINKERDVRFTAPKIIKKKTKKGKGKGKKGSSDESDEDDDFEIEEDNSGHNDDDIYAKEIRDKYKNIKYIDKKPYIYSINNNDVDKWLQGMRDKSELLPNNLIDNIINYDIDNVETVITNNIKKLKKVKKNIGSDFLNCKYINYRELLLNICKILYVNVNSSPTYKENETLQNKIITAIKDIKKIIKHLYKLNKITNNDNMELINTINILIISNCLNHPDLSGIENIPSDFITYNAEELYEYLKSYLEGDYNKFLTPEEITIFINKKREEYKNIKLKENQNLDIEENEIRRQVKAAGIIKDNYNNNVNDAADAADAADIDAKKDDGNDVNDYKDDEKDDDYNCVDNDNYNDYNDDEIEQDI